MELNFVSRSELKDYEWNNVTQKWSRPSIDPKILRQLNKRSAFIGSLRVLTPILLMTGLGILINYLHHINLLLAFFPFLLYTFVAGFLNGLEHELRHRIVFPKQYRLFSDFIYFLMHVLMRQGTVFQTISHQTHHRYTMVDGVDPEKIHPNPLTVKWVRKTLTGLAMTIITLGIPSFVRSIFTLTKRVSGNIEPLIARQASKKDIRMIRIESLLIIVINMGILLTTILLQEWILILLLICGPQMGIAIASFWWMTQHIGMMVNTNDQRLASRGLTIFPLARFLYGGLDEHVEHHLFPAVPSHNLTKLREALKLPIPKRVGVIRCWKEIIAIAEHQEVKKDDVLVTIDLKSQEEN